MEAELKGIFSMPPPPPQKKEEPVPAAETEAAPEQAAPEQSNEGADAEMKEEEAPVLEENKE